MQAFAHATSGTSINPRGYASGRRAMRVTMRAAYLFFFAVTVARRANPFARKTSTTTSLLAETRARAAAIVPFIFMG